MEKTIAAISTAPGNAGIGIVRVSGEKSIDILNKMFISKNKKNEKVNGYTIKYGHIINKNEEIIDEVLVSFFLAPKSYTGETMCEINSHGNIVVLKKILEICLENGAVLAEPGEFTKRAFLNGRIDLLQAEAVIDVINAKSEMERKAAINGLEGILSRDIKEIKNKMLDIITNIEVSIDYPEYDIEEENENEILKKIYDIINDLEKLEKTFERGKLLRDGVKVAIIGKPNVGKSSLLNCLLREEKAIVTNIEGTTRDTIEEFINIKGIPFKIIDTAGIRDTNNEIEKIGIEKSKNAINKADIVIVIFDVTKELSEEDKKILEIAKDKKKIILLNKNDLPNKRLNKEDFGEDKKDIIEVSIKDNTGIEDLYEKLVKEFEQKEVVAENANVITNIRHKNSIHSAKECIKKVENIIKDNMPIDVSAIYLKEAIKELNTITGENVTDDIINDIFSKFCLGK